MKPLEGTVILDLTRLLPGAVASMFLANFGAEVIKVEEPQHGDYARQMPPLIEGEGAYFRLTNGGKKSVAIDLKHPLGKAAFLRLAERSDVLLEGFRPGVMDRLGLGYEQLRGRNERLIYAAVTGYGQSGPLAGLAGHDINYISLGGILEGNREAGGPPVIPGVQLADLAGGALQAVTGILLALAARVRTGRGQMVDVAMLDGSLMLLFVPLAHLIATGRMPEPGGESLTGRFACYNVYEAGDGRYLSVGALEPKFWAALCRALACEQFIPDQFAEGERQRQIVSELARIFKSRGAREWFDFFKTQDVCVTPVEPVAELIHNEHLRVREMIVTRDDPEKRAIQQIGVTPKLSETPGQLSDAAPPRLGQHTREVLSWAGLSADELKELEQKQIIRT